MAGRCLLWHRRKSVECSCRRESTRVGVYAMAFRRTLPLALLPLAWLASCGGNSAGTLQSITVSPASATPAANGAVQFVATAHYINPTRSVTPLQVEAPMHAGWSYTASSAQSSKLTLTQNGLATCTESGTFIVAAWVESNDTGPVCNAIGPGGAPCESTFGTAQLTCP
jgi:hypothetical protein